MNASQLVKVDCRYLPIGLFLAEKIFFTATFFKTQFEFLLAQNLCKTLVLVIRVLFSKFGFSHFSSIPKGQIILKANCQAMISSKKRTNEFVFTSMRCVFVRFLEEIEATEKAFGN